MKPETSNLKCRFAMKSTNENMQNPRGDEVVTLFYRIWDGAFLHLCVVFVCSDPIVSATKSCGVSTTGEKFGSGNVSSFKKNLRSLASCGYTLKPSSASNNSVSGTFVVSKTVRAWEGVTWLATAGGARTPIPYVTGRNRQGQVRLVISDYTL